MPPRELLDAAAEVAREVQLCGWSCQKGLHLPVSEDSEADRPTASLADSAASSDQGSVTLNPDRVAASAMDAQSHGNVEHVLEPGLLSVIPTIVHVMCHGTSLSGIQRRGMASCGQYQHCCRC